MSHTIKQLSQLCDIVMGRTPARKKPEYWGKGNKWVSIADLTSKIICDTKEEITDYAVTQTHCRKVPKGTLLFSFKLTIGKMAFAGCDLYTNEAIAALHIKNKKELYAEYLYFALQAAKLLGSNQAAMGKTLNSKSLAQIEIPIPEENGKPNLDDQKRIAHLLGKVEGLIARHKQHLQQLDDLLKSVFLEMFGDPVRNEKGWDKPSLKQFGSISTGNTPPRKALSNYSSQYIEWIKTDNISADSVFISQAAEYLSETGATKARTVTKGALMVACIAGSVESIGRAALTDRIVAFNQQINAIQPNQDVNPFYLYVLFKISKKYIQSYASKGMKKILTKGDFEKITMIKPPVDLQNQFAAIVEKAEGIKSRYKQSLTDLEQLYGALSQKAFKGELDLSQVPLPSEGPEITAEGKSDTADKQPMETSFALPEPEELAVLLQSAEGRKTLVGQWLTFWLEHLGNAPFAAQSFMEAAQKWLWKLAEDDAPDWGVAEYDELKAWVFDALEKGRLTQGYDDANNRVQVKTIKG
jgi:type I restriction enzyme S subunit